jgi:hypothetical protein
MALQSIRPRLAMLLVLAAPFALAHGDREAKYGGILNTGGEITFELVRKGGDLILHVDDHGEPVATAGATGTLEIRNERTVRSVPVTSAGDNTLKAEGADFSPGDRMIVRAVLGSGIMLIGRFATP